MNLYHLCADASPGEFPSGRKFVEFPPGRKNAKQRLTLPGVLLAFFVFLSVSSALLLSEDCLVAKCDDRLLFVWPIKTGDCFIVTFTHSLNLSPITDVVEWSGSEMILRKSIFKTFGAGVPTPADGIGTELIFVDGHYELSGIDRHMKSFTIITQTIPDHRISLNGHEAHLLEFTDSGSLVAIAVIRVNLLRRLMSTIQNF